MEPENLEPEGRKPKAGLGTPELPEAPATHGAGEPGRAQPGPAVMSHNVIGPNVIGPNESGPNESGLDKTGPGKTGAADTGVASAAVGELGPSPEAGAGAAALASAPGAAGKDAANAANTASSAAANAAANAMEHATESSNVYTVANAAATPALQPLAVTQAEPQARWQAEPQARSQAEPQTGAPALATIHLVEKHPLAIRWMHWINFPVLFTMIWSGLLIYWVDSDPAQGHAHQVYRIGLGSFTLVRFFPDWFWKLLHAPYQVTTGLGWHFFFMWIFAANGLLYVLYVAFSGEWRFLLPTQSSLREALQVVLHDLHLRRQPLPRRKFNGAQQIAYTAVVLMGAGSLATGLAIYKPTQLHLITELLGGYEMARWLHFLLTAGFCLFFLIHVSQVVRAGWNNFRAMVSGYEVAAADEPAYAPERQP